MKLSNLIALLTNRSVQGNAYVKNGELYQGNTAQAILVKNQTELDEVKKHVAPGSIAYTAGYGSMWQLSAAGSWEAIEEEGGSGGGGLVIHQTVDAVAGTKTMDKTWQEIYDAVEAGGFAVLVYNDGQGFLNVYPVFAVGMSEGEPLVHVYDYYDGQMTYAAVSVNSYPVKGSSQPK